MKKFFFTLSFIIIALILVLILRSAFPNYAGFLRIFFVFLLLDAYLWFSLLSCVSKLKPVIRILITILYWFPLALALGCTITGFVIPFTDWYQPLRTQVMSFILIVFISKFLPAVALLIADFIRAIRFLYAHVINGKIKFGPFNQIHRNKPVLLSGWIVGGVLFLTLFYGTVFGNYNFRVREQVVPVSGLPAAFDGLRIVHISDIHLGSWTCKSKLEKAVSIINNLHPDLIFFTGDMFNYCTKDGNGFEPVLSKLRAPLGIFAVMGNHDYGDYMRWHSGMEKLRNLDDARKYYKMLGWNLLLNSNKIIRRGNDSIAVLGVENWGATRRFRRMGNVERAQKGAENFETQLLLSHDPTHWDSIVSRHYPKIDFTFSGHTHGGQIGIDGWGIHWSPSKWLYKEWCGLYKKTGKEGTQYLYVNQGLGSVGYAGRIGINPEITLIILTKQ